MVTLGACRWPLISARQSIGLTRDREGDGESESSMRNCFLLLFFRFYSRKFSGGCPTPTVGEVVATHPRDAPTTPSGAGFPSRTMYREARHQERRYNFAPMLIQRSNDEDGAQRLRSCHRALHSHSGGPRIWPRLGPNPSGQKSKAIV